MYFFIGLGSTKLSERLEHERKRLEEMSGELVKKSVKVTTSYRRLGKN